MKSVPQIIGELLKREFSCPCEVLQAYHDELTANGWALAPVHMLVAAGMELMTSDIVEQQSSYKQRLNS
jgi:hypothetical protein